MDGAPGALQGSQLRRSVWQLASAAALFAGAWALMYASLRVGYWLTLLLAVPAAFFLIRLLSSSTTAATQRLPVDARGRHRRLDPGCAHADAVPLLEEDARTPSRHLGQSRAPRVRRHDTLTVDEYLARSRWERFKYRVYRHPAVLFGVAPCCTSSCGTASRHRAARVGRASGAASSGPTSGWRVDRADGDARRIPGVRAGAAPVTLCPRRSACGCSTSSTSSSRRTGCR